MNLVEPTRYLRETNVFFKVLKRLPDKSFSFCCFGLPLGESFRREGSLPET